MPRDPGEAKRPSARAFALQLALAAAVSTLLCCLPWMLRDFSDHDLHLTAADRARLCLRVALGPLTLVSPHAPLIDFAILSAVAASGFIVIHLRQFLLVRVAAFVMAVSWALLGAALSSLAI